MPKKKRMSLRATSIKTEETWRVFRIMAEFIDGFEFMSNIGKAVSIFGSSHLKPQDRYYKIAEKIYEQKY